MFGDQLTEVNIVGVMIAITGEPPMLQAGYPESRIRSQNGKLTRISGIALYTYHKYKKSIASPISHPLDSPSSPSLHGHQYASIRREGEGRPNTETGMPLSTSASRANSPPTPSTYPPLPPVRDRETAEDRTQRLRDDFEGWNREDDEVWSGDEDEPELDAEEVERRMTERDGGKGSDVMAKRRRWGEWWEKEM